MRVIEGTWEEIERHKAELMGQWLRVTVKPQRPTTTRPSAPAQKSPDTAQPKVLRARGMLAGLLSTEEYFREKREDTAREDCDL